jgi:hypothetical protein
MIRNKFFSFFLFLALAGVGCTSQYHWVKATRADPQKINKQDPIPANLPMDLVSLGTPADLEDSKSHSSWPIHEILPEKSPDHGMVSIHPKVLEAKVLEIRKNLGAERIKEMKSENAEIRNQALELTLKEQLNRSPFYSKLSSERKDRLEKRLSQTLSKSRLKTLAKSNSGFGLEGINNLLLAGLILLVFSILFFVIPGIGFLGVLFDVVAAVLIILGLVQMLG